MRVKKGARGIVLGQGKTILILASLRSSGKHQTINIISWSHHTGWCRILWTRRTRNTLRRDTRDGKIQISISEQCFRDIGVQEASYSNQQFPSKIMRNLLKSADMFSPTKVEYCSACFSWWTYIGLVSFYKKSCVPCRNTFKYMKFAQKTCSKSLIAFSLWQMEMDRGRRRLGSVYYWQRTMTKTLEQFLPDFSSQHKRLPCPSISFTSQHA